MNRACPVCGSHDTEEHIDGSCIEVICNDCGSETVVKEL